MNDDENISHRFLEYAVSDRATCAGACKSTIPMGALRYGTKTHVMDHDSITWRCMNCITHRQAENILKAAKEVHHTVHDYLTVPPEGPPAEVVDLFLRFMQALHENREEDVQKLRDELWKHTKESDAAAAEKKPKRRRKMEEDRSVHELDRQITEDVKMLKLFRVGDLRSLCSHHGLDSKGTKPVLVERLQKLYTQRKAPLVGQ